MPWHYHCTDLLTNTAMKNTLLYVRSFISAVNVLSLIFQKMSFKQSFKKGIEKTGAFSAVAASVNFADLLCVVPLWLIWSVDASKTGHLTQITSEWRSSFFCFSIFNLFLYSAILSPHILCLFSYARFSVVDHPMDTKFKETSFVRRWIVGHFLFCLLGSSTLTILTWIVDVKIMQSDLPVPICLPFVDFSKTMTMIKIINFLTCFSEIGATFFIISVYTNLILSLKASQKRIAQSVSKQQSNTSLIVQIACFIIATLLCWISTSCIYLLCMYLKQYPVRMVTWTVVVAYPVNAICNPVILLVTSVRKLLK